MSRFNRYFFGCAAPGSSGRRGLTTGDAAHGSFRCESLLRGGGFAGISGAELTGAVLPILTLFDVSGADIGAYDAIVSNNCGSATSNPATLALCPADFNCSGAPDSQDFFDFLAAYFAGAPAADFDHSGSVDSADFFAFLAAFFAGC